jgi:hypothetical protein
MARNTALDAQLTIDGQLYTTLAGAPDKDTVQITITKFRDVLSEDARAAGKEHLRMCDHMISLNGKTAMHSTNPSLARDFKKTLPKTVEISVIDGEKPLSNPRHQYYPIGIAFKNGPHPKVKKTNLIPNDFANGKVYLFGAKMFLTVTDKFKFKDLSKYAVIVQREDTQIGIIDPPVINEM